MNYEAFVYCWTNNKNGKKYIGYHKGSIDDGYISSSKKFLNEYQKNTEDFSREIIAVGNVCEMVGLEKKLLIEVNAAKNSNYYNSSNGGAINFTPEIIEKMRKPKSQETVEKMRKPKTKQHAENISKGHIGLKLSDETRAKISAAAKKQIRKPHSRETIELIKQKKKEYWANRKKNESLDIQQPTHYTNT